MGNFNYAAVIRIRRGVTAEQALAEINVVQARFPRLAGLNRDLKAMLIPVHELVTGRAPPPSRRQTCERRRGFRSNSWPAST